MFKIIKWAYELGIRHERRRVRLLIAEHRQQKPDRESWDYRPNNGLARPLDYDFDLAVWAQTQNTLGALIEPSTIRETAMIAPLDED